MQAASRRRLRRFNIIIQASLHWLCPHDAEARRFRAVWAAWHWHLRRDDPRLYRRGVSPVIGQLAARITSTLGFVAAGMGVALVPVRCAKSL